MWLADNDSVQGCTTRSWSKRTIPIVCYQSQGVIL
jgi:hypothetical protein